MRDWSSHAASGAKRPAATARPRRKPWPSSTRRRGGSLDAEASHLRPPHEPNHYHWRRIVMIGSNRSEEHTSELQSLMRNSYAVFCLKKKTDPHTIYIIDNSDSTIPNTKT